MTELELVTYRTPDGRAPFEEWFRPLARTAPTMARRIVDGLDRLRSGNTGALKSLGRGLYEIRFPFGPGYRVYCGQEGGRLVILLAGGDKATQDRDIARARGLLADWRSEKEA